MRFILLKILTLLTLSSSGQNNEQKGVNQCFASYKQAILASDGQEAIKWVDKNTLNYYDKMLGVSIAGDSSAIDQLSLIDKITVLSVRHRIPHNEILTMDGNSFFVYAINNGMVGKSSVMSVDLGDIKVEGKFATGQIVSNGQNAPFYFHFHKENETWKIDLTSIFTISTMALKKVVSDSGMTETEWLFEVLEMLTGNRPDSSIWLPLKRE